MQNIYQLPDDRNPLDLGRLCRVVHDGTITSKMKNKHDKLYRTDLLVTAPKLPYSAARNYFEN